MTTAASLVDAIARSLAGSLPDYARARAAALYVAAGVLASDNVTAGPPSVDAIVDVARFLLEQPDAPATTEPPASLAADVARSVWGGEATRYPSDFPPPVDREAPQG